MLLRLHVCTFNVKTNKVCVRTVTLPLLQYWNKGPQLVTLFSGECLTVDKCKRKHGHQVHQSVLFLYVYKYNHTKSRVIIEELNSHYYHFYDTLKVIKMIFLKKNKKTTATEVSLNVTKYPDVETATQLHLFSLCVNIVSFANRRNITTNNPVAVHNESI